MIIVAMLLAVMIGIQALVLMVKFIPILTEFLLGTRKTIRHQL